MKLLKELVIDNECKGAVFPPEFEFIKVPEKTGNPVYPYNAYSVIVLGSKSLYLDISPFT